MILLSLTNTLNSSIKTLTIGNRPNGVCLVWANGRFNKNCRGKLNIRINNKKRFNKMKNYYSIMLGAKSMYEDKYINDTFIGAGSDI